MNQKFCIIFIAFLFVILSITACEQEYPVVDEVVSPAQPEGDINTPPV